MIIRWRSAYDDFCKQTDMIVGSNGCAEKSKIKELKTCRWRNIIICVIWIVAVIIPLVLPTGAEVLKQYCFCGYGDPNYWIFIVCVAFIAYQTSCFFLMLLISWRTIREITQNSTVIRNMLLNEGRSDGLSLIGSLISRSAIYFGSGLLFFPIMIEFFISSGKIPDHVNTTAIVFILMAIYLFVILIYLWVSGKCVVGKCQIEKDNVLKECDKEREELNERLDCYFIDQKIRYISGISVNPLATDLFLKTIYGVMISAFLPSVFNFLLSLGL